MIVLCTSVSNTSKKQDLQTCWPVFGRFTSALAVWHKEHGVGAMIDSLSAVGYQNCINWSQLEVDKKIFIFVCSGALSGNSLFKKWNYKIISLFSTFFAFVNQLAKSYLPWPKPLTWKYHFQTWFLNHLYSNLTWSDFVRSPSNWPEKTPILSKMSDDDWGQSCDSFLHKNISKSFIADFKIRYWRSRQIWHFDTRCKSISACSCPR